MGVPNKQNMFHFNKPLHSLGTWTGDMRDKGFTGILRQGFLRRKKNPTRTHLVLYMCFPSTRKSILCKGPSGQPVFYN